jgi:hypothetical protein
MDVRRVDDDDLVGEERWNFRVLCNNGDQHTSDHIYNRISARDAARAYCAERDGINGRPTYTMRTIR